jgi:hypothetical protein
MKRFAGTLVGLFMLMLYLGLVAEAANTPYPVGNVFCDGTAPAYFMGIKNTEEDAITSMALWTQEYQDAGGEIAAGEDSSGKFGWSKEWKIVGIWVWAAADPSRKHPCTTNGQQGKTLECHFFVVRHDAPTECESCIEKAGLASYGLSRKGQEKN